MVASNPGISEIYGFKYGRIKYGDFCNIRIQIWTHQIRGFLKYLDTNTVASNTRISEIFGFKYADSNTGKILKYLDSNIRISEIFGFKFADSNTGVSNIFGFKFADSNKGIS